MHAAWWWIDRWRKSTAYTDMTLAEQGAYRNLLDELWLRDGLLPNDERILAKICGDAMSWATVRTAVLARFEVLDQGLRNPTHDEVSARSKALHEARSKAGKKGNAARWDIANGIAKPIAKPIANGIATASSPSPSPSPISGSVSEEKLPRSTKTERVGRAAESTIPYPDWLPVDSWLQFVEARRQMGKRMTPHAKELTIKKLAAFREQGHDPKHLIELAIERGWQGIYVESGRNGRPTPPEPTADELEAALQRERDARRP